ncbi:tetratricopeptide repeat protein [Aquiflexum gelatinilyticum]|uniref:Tetratricopeptide repeat protein n=1 Tax=Aquiflexum gelatinilyticum TaxID=2961943 RepID=A0A9X2SZQ2_9BACT|nr:tetratricopeptide repeat protein [Aquiflexum gelatinilyticum]MCR9016714.1 hypothetical protein [Aquiflexum gelatinilyticum]
MLDDKYIALLDDYLDGNLNQEEADKLLSEINSNPDLKELLDILAFSRESIRMSGHKETVNKIYREFEKKQSNQSPKGKVVKFKPFGWVIGIAATMTLLLVGNYWVQNLPDSLYQEKYITYEIPTMRSDGDEEKILETHFKNKSWDSVTKGVSIEEPDRKILFLAAVSYFELGDDTNAILYLNKLKEINADSQEKLFEDEIDYYLFLSYLKSENYEAAKSTMAQIVSNPKHTYHGSFGIDDRIKIFALDLFKP